jgi:hypothetical protein
VSRTSRAPSPETSLLSFVTSLAGTPTLRCSGARATQSALQTRRPPSRATRSQTAVVVSGSTGRTAGCALNAWRTPTLTRLARRRVRTVQCTRRLPGAATRIQTVSAVACGRPLRHVSCEHVRRRTGHGDLRRVRRTLAGSCCERRADGLSLQPRLLRATRRALRRVRGERVRGRAGHGGVSASSGPRAGPAPSARRTRTRTR